MIDYITVEQIHAQLKNPGQRSLSWLSDWAASGAGKFIDGVGWAVPANYARICIREWNA